MIQVKSIPKFWSWLIFGCGGKPGFSRIIDGWIILHACVGLLLAFYAPMLLQEAANSILIPLAGLLIGLSFAWAANAQALLQSEEIEEITKNSVGGFPDYVYSFLLAVLVVLVSLSLWGLWDKYYTGCARRTAAVRRAIQSSQESLMALAARYDISPKTVHKWRKSSFVVDAARGPKPRSTTLSEEQEAIVIAFRKHTLLPLDDCLYALQANLVNRTEDNHLLLRWVYPALSGILTRVRRNALSAIPMRMRESNESVNILLPLGSVSALYLLAESSFNRSRMRTGARFEHRKQHCSSPASESLAYRSGKSDQRFTS
jgi:transposase-like protein